MIVKKKIVENGVEKEIEVEMTEQEMLLDQTKDLVLQAAKDVAAPAIEAMKQEFIKWSEEQKEKIEKGIGIYNKDVKVDRKAMNERFRKGVIAVLSGDTKAMEEVARKEMTTDDQATPYTGYTVDHELDAEIRHLITNYGVARRNMEVLTLSKGSYKMNELTTDITVGWADEAASMLSTQWVTGQKELTLEKLYAIVTFTNELLEDSEIDLFRFIAERAAEGMAYKEDLAFFMGDGTATYGSFTGVVKSALVNAVSLASGTTFASMTADDLIGMIDATPQGALANGKYYMHRSIMSIVRKLKDENNQYIFQRPSEGGPATIWGYPVETVEVMPTATSGSQADKPFVLFGDLRKGAILGTKGGLRVEKFNAGAVRNVANNADINLITTDRQAIRFVERVGYCQIITTLNKPLTVLSTNAASA